MPTIPQSAIPTRFFGNDITSHCRLSSINRFGDTGYKTKGLITDEDIHGLKWNERMILKVVAYDRTEGKVIVRNTKGMEWLMEAKKITFCNKFGNI